MPPWWIDKMTVHHVYLHRFHRASKCAARTCALAIAGGVPVRWWGTTRRKAATSGSRRPTRRAIAERGGGRMRRVISGRVGVSVGVYMLPRWTGDGVRVGVGVRERTRERASDRGGIHPANPGRRGKE